MDQEASILFMLSRNWQFWMCIVCLSRRFAQFPGEICLSESAGKRQQSSLIPMPGGFILRQGEQERPSPFHTPALG
jgi:hypothetical protein